jgi:MFS family permease
MAFAPGEMPAEISVSRTGSIESRKSWVVAWAALAILSLSYGAPLVAVVALKPIAADLDAARSAPAIAGSLAYLGSGLGGILMGWLAERIGVRAVVMFGSVMVCIGLYVASQGGLTALYLGYGLLVGLVGTSGMFAPLMTYVTRWFDRKRGTAVALISSGQYIAGTVWPALFQLGIDRYGWRRMMATYGMLVVCTVLPLALIFLRRPPAEPAPGTAAAGPASGKPVLGLNPNLALGVLSVATFFCCVTMSMPLQHLVAFCSDLGFAASHGPAMLSLLLACAFLSRQFWGWLADRIGGLRTVLATSVCQALAMSLFLTTQNEYGLFTISAVFGFGFAGLIPGYVLTVRELFPAREASWRVPVILFLGLTGMATGGWLAGAIYDYFGYYAPAFLAGIFANLANLALIGSLLWRSRSTGYRPAFA